MKRNDVFGTPQGDLVVVQRVAQNHAWADIRVTQPHGATWTKRQPLVNGAFAFEFIPLFIASEGEE